MKKRSQKNGIARASLMDKREQRAGGRKKEIEPTGCLRGREQETDLESSQLYRHLTNLMPLWFCHILICVVGFTWSPDPESIINCSS